jgi:hypothetical protein
MKKIIFLPVLIFICCACLTAVAQEAQNTRNTSPLAEAQDVKPATTPPETVAMVFYKLSRRAPNFESWVRQMDSYKNASPFDQPAIMTDMVQKMKDAYNLLMTSEPLIVETQVTLAPYDAKNQGFFVESFKPSTFFPARFDGQSYAIVPQGIMDKQWLKVDDPMIAATVEASAGKSNHVLTMVLLLTPKFADSGSAATIDGESYWPIAADIKRMMLYPLNGESPLWQSYDNDSRDKNHQSILNLYQ